MAQRVDVLQLVWLRSCCYCSRCPHNEKHLGNSLTPASWQIEQNESTNIFFWNIKYAVRNQCRSFLSPTYLRQTAMSINVINWRPAGHFPPADMHASNFTQQWKKPSPFWQQLLIRLSAPGNEPKSSSVQHIHVILQLRPLYSMDPQSDCSAPTLVILWSQQQWPATWVYFHWSVVVLSLKLNTFVCFLGSWSSDAVELWVLHWAQTASLMEVWSVF